MMNGNPVIIESNSEGSVSSSLKMGVDSELFPFISGYFKLEVLLLSDDSKMKGLSR